MIRLLPVVLLSSLIGLWGCATTEPAEEPALSHELLASTDDPEASLDSLQAVTKRLENENRRLRDSLQLYDDIDSGQYRRTKHALQDDLTRLSYELGLLRDGGQSLAHLSTDDLFEPGTAHLTEAGHARLNDIAERLRTTYRDRTIRVESHTDDQPLSSDTYNSHWALSAARAATVVEALMERSRLNASQFQALGFGDAQPTASNATSSGQARNRRIRIAVLPPVRDLVSPYEIDW